MFGVFFLILLACLVGLVRPFAGQKRKVFGLGALAAFVLMLVTVPEPNPATVAVTASNEASGVAKGGEAATAEAPQPAAAEESSPWSYDTDQDKVRGGTTYFASTTSTNSIAQNFPYDAETTMNLTVRKSPAHGTDVIFTVSSGQMMCPSYDGCSGTASFDGGPPEKVSFAGPADNSSDTIFVENSTRFLRKLKSSKKLVLEKTLYEAGSPQFEFDVSNLKWEH